MATTQTETQIHETVLTPRVDLFENESEFLLEADLPGVKREDVSLSLQDGQLTLEGVRSFNEEEQTRTVFRRSFKFRPLLDEEKIEARLEKGVLHLHLPKSPEVQPRQIEIQTV